MHVMWASSISNPILVLPRHMSVYSFLINCCSRPRRALDLERALGQLPRYEK